MNLSKGTQSLEKQDDPKKIKIGIARLVRLIENWDKDTAKALKEVSELRTKLALQHKICSELEKEIAGLKQGGSIAQVKAHLEYWHDQVLDNLQGFIEKNPERKQAILEKNLPTFRKGLMRARTTLEAMDAVDRSAKGKLQEFIEILTQEMKKAQEAQKKV
ncbi:MAG: hypothetical protein KJ601_04810 [Nanoarchaeota archaeon]|nr:hypothetical protein [Nanoarchaeota archaeon]MBU1704533.1 hypothetical protein [Nanoarchaeota archaeon]